MARSKKTKNLLRARRRKVFARRSWMTLRIILILAFFAAALWGLNHFYNSSYFKIKTVEISGNIHYQDGTIIETMPDIRGENIFEADKKEAEDMLLENLVWLSSVEFKKIFPDSIEIEVTERKPALILVHRSRRYLLDGEGMVLEDTGQETSREYAELLEVRGAIDHSLEPGDVVAKKNVLSCADIYMGFDEDLKAIISKAGIKDNASGDIYFTTMEGMEIIFGDSSQVIKKIEVLKLLLKEDTVYNIIDLKSPDNPVFKK